MLHSAEIRWFFPAVQRGAFTELFPESEAGDVWNHQEAARDDVYRVAPDCEVLGLKVRGGKGLELKALRAAPEPFRWTPPLPEGQKGKPAEVVLGRTDVWLKWDLPEQPNEKLMAGAREVKLTKRRWLRKYSADAGTITQVHAAGKRLLPRSGCNVERTHLDANGEQFLTIGFEAFGEPERIRAILADTVVLIFSGASAELIQAFSTADSRSYPVWLAALVRKAAG
jgi:hypothetical protein